MTNPEPMRIIFLTLLFQFIFLFSFCQPVNEKSDSITSRTDIPISPELSATIDSLKSLLGFAKTSEDKYKILGQISWAFAATRIHLQHARKYADSIKLLAEEFKDEKGIAYAHFYYGFIARHAGDFDKGLEHFQFYVAYNARQGDSGRVATGMYQIGVLQYNKGDYIAGLAAYHRALKISQQMDDFYQEATILNSIGIMLKKLKRYEESIDKYRIAAAIFDSLNALDRGYVRTNIANAYAESGNYDSAKVYYQYAMEICKSNKEIVEVAAILENIGNMYNKMNQYDSALHYLLQSASIFEKTLLKDEIALVNLQIADAYINLKNYSLAPGHLDRALSIAKEIESRTLIRDSYKIYATLFSKMKDFEKAYEYEQLFTKIKDSVLDESIAKQISELQTKYETAEKNKQIQLLAADKQLQEKETQRQAALKETFLIGAILLGLLALLLVYLFRQQLKHQKLMARKNDEIKEMDFRRQMSELEMKALRAQINPHFLFNCMNSINRMILQGDTENASAYLVRFSKLVRLILENAESPTVSLENEMALLESYIRLEELRFKGKIHYDIVIDEAIQADNIYLPSMVLQPFVENAIWHGLMHKKQDEMSTIYIGIREENDLLLCTIEDNGVGREMSATLRELSVFNKKSMGMKITEDRLRLLSRERHRQLIHVTDMKDNEDNALGTRIEITIPIS